MVARGLFIPVHLCSWPLMGCSSLVTNELMEDYGGRDDNME